MKASVGIWTALSRLIMFLIVVAALIGVGLWYLPLIRTNQNWRQKELKLQQRIEEEKARKERLEASVQNLKTNTAAIERAARERLGYAAPDEVVIRFEPADEEASSRPSETFGK